MKFVNSETWITWAVSALTQVSVPDGDARIVAAALAQTSLWGIDSHGIVRLPHYLFRLSNKTVTANPNIKRTQRTPAVCQFDGDNGLGILICHRAMSEAIEMTRQFGVGIVGISRSSHCGALGLYTRQACREGMIGIALTHSDGLVAPHLGTRPFFGTNPVSIAIPTEDPMRPLCVDMATSIVAWNKIMNARNRNEEVPPTWGVDEHGLPSQDPWMVKALRPLGEHKGYALSFLIDMLCGPLNAMAFGPHLSSMYGDLERQRNLGSLVMAFDYKHFAGGNDLPSVVSRVIREVKEQGPDVLYPGEPEYIAEETRSVTGIPVEEHDEKNFAAWSNRLSISNLP